MDKKKLEQSIRQVLKLNDYVRLNVWYDDYGSNRVYAQYCVMGGEFEEKNYMFQVDKDNSKVIMAFELNAKEMEIYRND